MGGGAIKIRGTGGKQFDEDYFIFVVVAYGTYMKRYIDSWIYGFGTQENNPGWRFRFENHLFI